MLYYKAFLLCHEAAADPGADYSRESSEFMSFSSWKYGAEILQRNAGTLAKPFQLCLDTEY